MRAVIFDFDGTLVDSFEAVMAVVHQTTKHKPLADINYVTTLRDSGMGLRKAVVGLGIPIWKWPWFLRDGQRLFKKEIERIPLFTGVEDVLKSLHEQHFELYIISNNSRENINRFLSEKGLLIYFKNIYGTVASIGLPSKEHVIRKVLKENRLSSSDVIYVGDEVSDIEAAHKMHMPVIAVTWGYNSERLLFDHNPTVIVRSPAQINKVITEWANAL